jgi:hypothetical protein
MHAFDWLGSAASFSRNSLHLPSASQTFGAAAVSTGGAAEHEGTSSSVLYEGIAGKCTLSLMDFQQRRSTMST